MMINLTITDRENLAVNNVILRQDEYDTDASIQGQLKHMYGNPDRTKLRMTYQQVEWLEILLMDGRGERWGSNDVTDHVLGRLNKIIAATIKKSMEATLRRIFFEENQS